MKIARILKLRDDTDIVRDNIEYYHALGVDLTFIMLHKPTDELMSILNDINVPIELFYWDKEGKYADPVNEEYLTILLNRATQNYQWIIGADADEFLILKKHKTLPEFLGRYNRYTSVSLILKWANYYAIPGCKVWHDMKHRSAFLRWTKSFGKFNKEMYYVQGMHYIADKEYGQVENVREVEVDPDVAFYGHFPFRTREQFICKLITQGKKFNTAYYQKYGADPGFYYNHWEQWLKSQKAHLRENSEELKQWIYDPINV